ncbi:MAG TPA: hypothetical protein VGO93_00600, partial [Candidatus Xenobia bacterium]
MIEVLRRLDRRTIYVIMALSVILPLLHPIRLPVTPSVPVIETFNFVEKIPVGGTILLSFDYGPSTAVELDPVAKSILQQCFRRGVRVIGMTLLADGRPFLDRNMAEVAKAFGKTEGTDWVDLGFQLGGFTVIKSLGNGFAQAFPTDRHGHQTTALPLMQQVHDYRDVALVMSLSAADPGIRDWIKIIPSEFRRPLGCACTAVYFAELAPFLNSGQLIGLVGGLRGAAEYEKLVGIPGTATQDMDAQSLA